jgi:hypothetical protein
MSKVVKLFREAAFDPEVVKALCLAYDCAIRKILAGRMGTIVRSGAFRAGMPARMM